MKRQSEELFFKYITRPTQSEGNLNQVSFAIPSDYSPIPGDIVEMIISEKGSYGFVSYYAKLVCYRPNFGKEVGFYRDFAALSGKLELPDGTFTDLDTAQLSGDEKLTIDLYAKSGTTIQFDNGYDHVVNLFVHRSKAIVDLYYL